MNNEEAARIYASARKEYLAQNPPPVANDFPCPQCGADPGVPCTWKRSPAVNHVRMHLARQDRGARAFNRAQRAATDHAWEAENAAWREARTQAWE